MLTQRIFWFKSKQRYNEWKQWIEGFTIESFTNIYKAILFSGVRGMRMFDTHPQKLFQQNILKVSLQLNWRPLSFGQKFFKDNSFVLSLKTTVKLLILGKLSYRNLNLIYLSNWNSNSTTSFFLKKKPSAYWNSYDSIQLFKTVLENIQTTQQCGKLIVSKRRCKQTWISHRVKGDT